MAGMAGMAGISGMVEDEAILGVEGKKGGVRTGGTRACREQSPSTFV
jgi:hypothetical protein